ncbi:MAG TPA: hypothetical protein PLW50_00695 [Smithellaceae bacterium]|nr:hypothetical protein [Smithellaceae bacterium]
MSDKFEFVLKPEGSKVEARKIPQERPTEKVFCAKKQMAMALLQDMITMAGAHNEAAVGKVPTDKLKELSKTTNEFFVNLANKLMVDCSLNEADIAEISERIAARLKKP